eukprot:m.80649 g.80649  ORF g.80649 m.80649 type:complete len:921 (+) comp13333_c0_seq4:81-2843(+)
MFSAVVFGIALFLLANVHGSSETSCKIAGKWQCEGFSDLIRVEKSEKGCIAVFRDEQIQLLQGTEETLLETSSGIFSESVSAQTQRLSWSRSLLCGKQWERAPLVEPYPALHGGQFVGPAQVLSPDPLANYVWNSSVDPTVLQVYMDGADAIYSAVPPTSFLNSASLIHTIMGSSLRVVGPGTLVLDFGFECGGWLEIQANADLTNTKWEMSISEYNEPGIYNSGPAHPNKTAVPVQYADGWYRLELNSELYEGVRFGFLHVLSLDQPFVVTSFRRVCQIKPTNYQGSFSSSDSTLTQVWWTAAYTVKVNLLSSYFGSILIDRGDRISWTGDAHTSQAAALVSLANYDFILENIDHTACPTCSNGIESYAIYWILSLCDYVRASGDTVALTKYGANVDAKLTHAFSIYNKSANLAFYGPDDRVGADFEYPSIQESQNAYCMLVIRACREYGDVLTQAGRGPEAQVYLKKADEYTAALRADPTWHVTFGLHASADAINAAVPSPAEAAVLVSRELNNTITICSFGPFNMYFVLTALARANHTDLGLDSVRRCWGGMLALGATTFWETFSPEWQRVLQPHDAIANGATGFTSMAHPWGAGVVKWLTEYLLGVRPLSLGYRRFLVQPGLGLATSPKSVNGTVPTPQGPIAFEFDSESLAGSLSFPSGTTGQLCFQGRLAACTIELDGRPAGYGCADVTRSTSILLQCPAAPDNKDVVRNYVIDKLQQRENQEPTFTALPPLSQYPAQFLARDSVTSGTWRGRYGKAGYVLWAHTAQGTDSIYLPTFVSRVGFAPYAAGRVAVLAANTSDTRALQDPRGSARRLGIHATQNPSACLQTIVFDIILSQPVAYKVTLYVVDWYRLGTRQVIEMRDPTSYNIIAPTQMVSDFGEGVYLTYAYNSSARFRINQVRNGDAVVSAVFFDV